MSDAPDTRDEEEAFGIEPTQVAWDKLLPHAKRDALWLVASSVSLHDVAAAIAADDAPRIQELLASGEMRKPTDAELEQDVSRTYLFSIVQPFVVAQGPLPDA